MITLSKWLAALATPILISGSSFADTLVDTGPGIPGSGGAWLYGAASPSPAVGSAENFIAGQFSLTSADTITGVNGWMSSSVAGTLTAAIFSNVNNLPGASIYASSFEITPAPPCAIGTCAGWFGPSGTDWTLSPGTYWLVFEVLPSDSLYTQTPEGYVTMGGTPSLPMSPLALYAFGEGTPISYTALDPSNGNEHYGMQVFGMATPVPLPATAWLLVSALSGLTISLVRLRPERLTVI